MLLRSLVRGVGRTANGHKVTCVVRMFSSDSKKPYFDKILIANRGEIACRVIDSCKKLGIKSVAIYSEPDAQAVHVMMADEAVLVGPAPSAQSYLVMDNIIQACKDTGAQAVHPGYGFLSENKEFQNRLEKEGIKFIGPGEFAITSMGDKIASKNIAREANVNTIPGWLGVIDNNDDLLKVANEIGYPVMIKASAGGGGKGMRVAYDDVEAKEGFIRSKNEAMASFGDDTIFLEKFIEDPRHIEIQILADAHDNVLYVNERECSIQRRNQKVMEEAPSVFLDAETRKAMGEQAAALARAVNYESAGTVEFLVDKHRNFYFLEMNTRLQVEHPVSEMITGVDLVEQMIRIAAGHKLELTQADIGIKGWAVESRVYAEDPLNEFLPSIGSLDRYVEPTEQNLTRLNGQPDVRCDSGVREGSDISIYYDPLISKLITYAETREEAIEKMRVALDSYVIRGVTSNVCFLRALMDHPKWLSGDITTKFIEEEYPDGFKGVTLLPKDHTRLVAGALLVYWRTLSNQVSITGQIGTFDKAKFEASKLSELVVCAAGNTYHVSVDSRAREGRTGTLTATVTHSETGESVEVTASSTYASGDLVFLAKVDGEDSMMQVIEAATAKPELVLQFKGSLFPITVKTALEERLTEHMPVVEEIDTARFLMSPMPGSVFSVNVQEGDVVVPGQEVCVIEAMKMQNAIRAAKGGTVKTVNVKAGDTVSGDDVLVEMEIV